MTKRSIVITILVTAIVASVFVVQAGVGAQFGWYNGSLGMTAEIWGLGTGAELTLEGFAEVTALCQNNGGNVAPGRSPISYTDTVSFDLEIDENGRAVIAQSDAVKVEDPTLSTFTETPVSPSAKELGCPSESWTAVGISVEWVGARVTVNKYNGSGNLTETVVWEFDCVDNGSSLDCTLK